MKVVVIAGFKINPVATLEQAVEGATGMIRFKPLFMADWVQPVFIHFRALASKLQSCVPFELDTWHGEAFLSLVAFTQSRLRPSTGGRVGEWLSAPLGHHEFLNLRTYVKTGGEHGIYFLSEWIPNRVAVILGPLMYGLPYRLGRLKYQIAAKDGRVCGQVRERQAQFQYAGSFDPLLNFGSAKAGSLDHFLIERYVAFTRHDGIYRRFDVAHDPWLLVPLRVELPDISLLRPFLPYLMSAQAALGHFSPGVTDVSISFPQKQTSGLGSDTLLTNPDQGAFRYVQSPC